MGNLFAHAVSFFIFDMSYARYELPAAPIAQHGERATSCEIALTKPNTLSKINIMVFTALI